jgi:hypothetical protein
MGTATPLVAVAIGLSAGIMGGIGSASAFHGGAAVLKGGKIDARDYGIDIGVGAATGLIGGGVGLGVTAAIPAAGTITGVAKVGVEGAVKVTGGVVTGVSGNVISDAVAIQEGKKSKDEFGKNILASALIGGVAGAITIPSSHIDKAIDNKAGAIAIKGMQVFATEGAKVGTKKIVGADDLLKEEEMFYNQLSDSISDAFVHAFDKKVDGLDPNKTNLVILEPPPNGPKTEPEPENNPVQPISNANTA